MITRCIHLNWKSVLLILCSIIFKGVQHLETETSSPESNVKHYDYSNSLMSVLLNCPNDIECSKLTFPCIECALSTHCVYGSVVNTTCTPLGGVRCTGSREMKRSFICKYCYQSDPKDYVCVHKTNCKSAATPREYYRTNCTVNNNVICLGNRKFMKREICNWTSGYKWTTTLLLSITLGGFGADRFYLGHWQEGIGKLFSFGGLGVWTLIDVLLISLHYLGPADGSLYI